MRASAGGVVVLVLFHELHLVAGFFSLVGLTVVLVYPVPGTVRYSRQEFRFRLLADTVVVTQCVSVQYGTLKAKGWVYIGGNNTPHNTDP